MFLHFSGLVPSHPILCEGGKEAKLRKRTDLYQQAFSGIWQKKLKPGNTRSQRKAGIEGSCK